MKSKYLCIFIPISIALYYYEFYIPCFIATFLSIIPLAIILCDYTDKVSSKLGDKVGGIINATTGNLPELLICIFAINSGMFDLVRAGIIGSIIGNMLLVQGISIFAGGIKYKEQTFNRNIARTNFALLFICIIGILVVSICSLALNVSENINSLSIGVSIILIIIYVLGLIFSLVTHKKLFLHDTPSEESPKNVNMKKCIFVFTVIALIMVLQSHILVNTLEYISTTFSISQHFLGIIVVPLIGNIGEYATAIVMALKNKINLCIEISVGSSIQIALLSAPILVIVSMFVGNPLSLVFAAYHILCLIIALLLSFFVFQDGKTYWLEGSIMIAAYVILALGYYFM
ncbi:calcium/proton exchanger [Clostridium cylindrosporum]|uniref:Ca(2+)/H(+) antiporter n=1 Tax=Clostridium cylindrosporum DSM 605 TaxID=1121307 RepID=A0A0J8D904_CLOCY|nr:calcium/proton exchanger [Clostridium cylindrosporum]KMT20834.1 Ca(2+)/H(+) antiporter [Clostridium cylindrosporum DSM 605]